MQQTLAGAFEQSVVDVFEITSVDGDSMTARSVRDGGVYRVHGHNEEAAPFAGLPLLGRLIPFEDDVWLGTSASCRESLGGLPCNTRPLTGRSDATG